MWTDLNLKIRCWWFKWFWNSFQPISSSFCIEFFPANSIITLKLRVESYTRFYWSVRLVKNARGCKRLLCGHFLWESDLVRSVFLQSSPFNITCDSWIVSEQPSTDGVCAQLTEQILQLLCHRSWYIWPELPRTSPFDVTMRMSIARNASCSTGFNRTYCDRTQKLSSMLYICREQSQLLLVFLL